MPASASRRSKTGELSLPGPFERDRLLGLELREGALDGAWGMIVPTGTTARAGKPRASRTRKLALAPLDWRHDRALCVGSRSGLVNRRVILAEPLAHTRQTRTAV